MTSHQINDFLNAGYSFIPVGNDKRPWQIKSWDQYQYRRTDLDDISTMNFRDAPGVAIIAGDVSGGIECIDFDLKNDPKGTIWDEFTQKISELKMMDIMSTPVIQSTQSGGFHIIYRCPSPGRSQKLAVERSGKPIIETRGNGSYFVVSPTPRYMVIQGKIEKIPTISQQDRNRIIECCQSLTRVEQTHTEYKKETNTENNNVIQTLDKICTQLESAQVDITQDYEAWVKIGGGLAHTLGENGRSYFHRISQFHPGYSIQEANYKYDSFLKTKYKNAYATVKSLFAVAVQHGVNIRVDDEDQQTMSDVAMWVQKQNFTYNEITRKIEYRHGDEINDIALNTLWCRCCAQLAKNVSEGKFRANVFNLDNVRSHNPVLEFMEDLRFRHYKGNPVDDYINHMTLKDERWKPFIKKWMLSVVAQSYGHNSELVLVLVGPQYIGKTEFFRRMFPLEFGSKFLTIDTLDKGKDSEILMTQKLVIVDDEFGGQNKKDSKHFKAMVSQKHFSIRMPYGRTTVDVRKLAVLAGASNDEHVINDYTGNRRILPVFVLDRDFDKCDAVNRYDLWAQLVQEYWEGETEQWALTYDDVDFIKEHSEQYQHVNPVREYIMAHWVPGSTYDKFMTATEICDVINEKHPAAKIYAVAVGKELAQLGFTRIASRGTGNIPKYGYYCKGINAHDSEGESADLPF